MIDVAGNQHHPKVHGPAPPSHVAAYEHAAWPISSRGGVTMIDGAGNRQINRPALAE